MATISVDFLVDKVISLLESEVSLLGGIHDELEEIKRELVSMRCFLEDADRNGAQSEGDKIWVASVRDMAYDVEDIIDEFMYHMHRQQGWGERRRLLYQTIRLPKDLWVRHRIASKLERIKTMIKAIPERRQRYAINNIEGTTSHSNHRWGHNHSESSLFLKDDDLVGIEDETQLLVGWLTDGVPQRTTISVVGMGGSGKTSLVAKVYKSQTVKRHFDCYAWISVSQTYVIEDLFRSMIKEFYKATQEAVPVDLSTMICKELVERLVDFLEPKKYIVVLDDVWNMNLWNEIKVSLPDGRHGSRVMLTTRKEDIASLSFEVGSRVHHIEPLQYDEAWSLFCMKAFSRNGNKCPPELKILAKDIVERCEGLPLAIVALGGLMSSKKLESEWRIVHKSLNWELSNNKMLQAVMRILLLSYNDLPYRLKHCFLYCCVFPEDYSIRRKRLIRLWMAEGFIEQVRGMTPEEVGESYLMELIRRSMLQVVERNPYGGPKACKMHDLLRELALSISEKEKFCVVHDGREAAEGSGARRLSIQGNDKEVNLCKGMSQLRSFVVFVALNTLPLGLKLLRVLDLEDVPIDNLPDELVNLFNLRYLNLTRTQVKKLPKSIGKLCNLQTLDIRETKIEKLPYGVVKLQNLRYLIMYRYNHGHEDDFDYVLGTQVPSNICELKNLQVLASVAAEGDLIKRLRSMTQLRRIGFTKVREADGEELCKSIECMPLLRHLGVMVTNENESLRMDALKLAPPYLKTLILTGKLEKVPRWFYTLQSLTYLHLHWSKLTKDLLPNIQALPNLGKLILIHAYAGKQLLFLEGFPKLTHLLLRRFPELNDIVIWKGVMPGLQELSIIRCPKLKTVPKGIEFLTCLQELNLAIVPEQVLERICGEGSEDHPKVRHIPKINHYYRTEQGMFIESPALTIGQGGVELEDEREELGLRRNLYFPDAS